MQEKLEACWKNKSCFAVFRLCETTSARGFQQQICCFEFWKNQLNKLLTPP